MMSRTKLTKRTRGRRKSRPRQGAFNLGRHTVGRNRGGRPAGPNPDTPHRSREDFPSIHPCLVTWRVVDGLPSLRRADLVRAIEDAFRRGCERGDFRLVIYSIQRDHFHLIVEADDRDALGRGMMSLAARIARAVNGTLGRKGKVFADRYHLRVLSSPRQVRNAVSYVLDNSRRHEKKRRARDLSRGMKVRPMPNLGTLDGASSARWFNGWRPDIAIDRTPPCGLGWLPAVAEARTWLLREGFKKHGWIDPNEIPG